MLSCKKPLAQLTFWFVTGVTLITSINNGCNLFRCAVVRALSVLCTGAHLVVYFNGTEPSLMSLVPPMIGWVDRCFPWQTFDFFVRKVYKKNQLLFVQAFHWTWHILKDLGIFDIY